MNKFNVNDTVYFGFIDEINFDDLAYDISDANDVIAESIQKEQINFINSVNGKYFYNNNQSLTDMNGFKSEEEAYKYIVNNLNERISSIKANLDTLYSPFKKFKYISSENN